MKKRSVKRLLAVMLTMSMMAGMLAGCGNTAGNTGAEASTDAAKETKETESNSVAESSETVEEEPVVIRMVAAPSGGSGDWVDQYWFERLEEELNVDIQLELISKDVWEEKTALYFASDNVPDIIIYDIDAATYGSQGYLLDMNEYISEELTPNIYRNLQEVPAIRSISQELDGSMYKLYGYSANSSLTRLCNWIKSDWCEEAIGKKRPETLDEYTEFLKYVRDNDMDGDGDATNEIPLTGIYSDHRSINIITSILGAFGHVTSGNQMEVDEDGKTAIFVPATDDYKEFLKYMNMLWEENLLDHEFFTQDNSLKSAKNASGRVAVVGDWGNPDAYETYLLLAPMTCEFNDKKVAAVNVLKQVSVIHASADTENPEKVMQVIDWFMDRENALLLTGQIMYGEDPKYPEYGYKWEYDKDLGYEKYVWYGPDGKDDVPDEYESVSAFRNARYTAGWEHVPLFSDLPASNYQNEDNNDGYSYANFILPYKKSIFPNVKRTAEENEDYGMIWTDLNAYYQQMETKMITGELDVDACWDEYIKGLKDRGLDRYVEIYQNGLDAYLGN